MARKTPPTVRKIILGNADVRPNGIVDIGQCLSLMNRKAFRQGMEYYVDSWSVSSESNCQAYLMTLQTSWVNSNAWTKAFHVWLRSQQQLDDYDEIKGRYHDFKVYLNEVHATAGMGSNIIPWDFNVWDVSQVSASAGASWDASEIQMPNVAGATVGYELHMVGPSSGSKGIVEGYAKSRARPQLTDPNVVEGGSEVGYWMDLAFDDGDTHTEIRTDLVTENDSPPYFVDEDTQFEFYPGGSNSANGAGQGVDVSGVLSIKPAVGSYITKYGPGFVAPCGLIWIVATPDIDFTITLNLAVGPYKGVMARPMQDVN